MEHWLKSDAGLVNYKKCKFGHNVSNKKGTIIYDLGEYEFDSHVGKTTYHNGVDLARVAGAIKYDEPYKGMSMYIALNGDDYVRIFQGSFKDITIKDFVMYFFQLLDGDIYISETNYHVFVKAEHTKKKSGKQQLRNCIAEKLEKVNEKRPGHCQGEIYVQDVLNAFIFFYNVMIHSAYCWSHEL